METRHSIWLVDKKDKKKQVKIWASINCNAFMFYDSPYTEERAWSWGSGFMIEPENFLRLVLQVLQKYIVQNSEIERKRFHWLVHAS